MRHAVIVQGFFDPLCQDITISFDIRQDHWHTFVCSSTSPEEQVQVFLTPSNLLGKEHYRLNIDKLSEYQPTLPELASSTRSKTNVSQCMISAQPLLQTEELMRRVTINGPISDSLVASILKYILEEARDKVVHEQVRIMHKSLQKAIASATAAASNLQLIRRDVALGQLQLQDEHIVRARTAPFQGHSLVGPEPQEFDEKIFTTGDQHVLHRGVTSHFKVPKKPARKSTIQLRPSVH